MLAFGVHEMFGLLSNLDIKASEWLRDPQGERSRSEVLE